MGPLFLPPPPVFHYQVKAHFFSDSARNFTEQPMKISLYGTLGEKEDISFVLYVHRMRQTRIPRMPSCYPVM